MLNSNNNQRLNIKELIKEYKLNKNFYINLTNNVINSVSDRLCHHKVIVLYIIQKFINIETYLELGVHNGASMSYVVNYDSKKFCFGIDLFEDTYIKNYFKDNLLTNKSYKNIQNNNKNNSDITLIKGNTNNISTEQKFIEYYRNVLGDKVIEVDLLFIDADHNYKPLLKDLKTYTKYLKKNGILILDDYPTGGGGGTKKALDEFLKTGNYEIIGGFNLNPGKKQFNQYPIILQKLS